MIAPLVSVVIPVHNRAHLVGTALDSVLQQDMADVEVVVVDDGSTDGLERVLPDDPRLRLIAHARNRGAAAARNTGLACACGRYVAFLDSDDEWLPGKLRRQLAMLRAAPATVRMCVTACILDRGGGVRQIRVPLATPTCRIAILRGCNLNVGSGAMVERGVFDEIGGFDEDLQRLEDWDWLLRFTRRWTYAVVPEPLAIIHVGDRPPLQAVGEALDQLWLRHAAGLARGDRQRFRSAHLIERAFSLYLAGRRLDAVAALGCALALDATRTGEMVARSWRRLRS